MKKTFMKVVVAALVGVAMVCSCSEKGKAVTNTKITEGDKSKMDTLSYCLGANMGGEMKFQLAGIDINLNVAGIAFKEAITGVVAQPHEEALEILQEFFTKTYGERAKAHQEALQADSTAVFKAFANDDECAKISYAIGNDMGTNIGKSKLALQYYWFWEGFEGGWNGESKLDKEQIMGYLNHYFMVVLPKEAADRSAKWVAKQAKQRGAKTTESGLVYKVINAGDMSKAAKNDEDVVKVHYIGKLQDGTVFDTSRFEYRSEEQKEMIRKYQPNLFDEKGNYTQEDQPIEFPLNRVIKGWTEGMKLVGPGGKIVLYIPADLAYGRNGAGQMIGPNEALEFEVELLEVKPAEVKPAEQPDLLKK